MKDTKRRMEFFSFYDHTGIEAHLERMAAKGWLLERMGSFTWHYRRIEPKRLTFSVCYFPEASQYDPGPSGKQEMFYDLCAHTGWTLAAASAQMQVFYNEGENPVPIDTDPELEVEAIHKAAKKGYLISQAMLGVVGLLNLFMFLSRLRSDPIRTLASPTSLFLAVCWPAMLLMIALDTGGYFLWRHRARKAAEQGEFLATRSHPMLQRVLLAIVLAAFVWATSSLSGGLALITVGTVAATLTVILLVSGVREVLRNNKTPAGTNKAVTIALCIVLSILLTAAIPFFVIRGAGSIQNTSPKELPLLLPALVHGNGNYSYVIDFQEQAESPLLAHFGGRQSPWRHEDMADGAPSLYYSVTVVKVPALYDTCKNHLLYENDTRGTDILPVKYYAPIDPAPWGAQEAYRFFVEESDSWTNSLVTENQDGMWTDSYLLCYPDRIVYFCPDWELTAEQMAIVGEKLGGT